MIETLGAVMTFLNTEDAAGREAAGALSAEGDRDALLDANPHWIRLGTFDTLLDIVRECIDEDVGRAEALTRFILRHMQRVEVPADRTVLLDLMHGTAHKHHASVLLRRGQGFYPEALASVEEAICIFSRRPALGVDRAEAQLVQAQIWNALGQRKSALDALKECATVFAHHGATRSYIRTLSQRGYCHFEAAEDTSGVAAAESLQRARTSFVKALDEAERIGDGREIARLQNNLGHCAAALGEPAAARAFFAQAVHGFTALRMTGEVPRALWGVAELDLAEGRVGDALSLLRAVHREFLERGMLSDAAMVLLEIARKIDARMPDRTIARDVCTYLAVTLESAEQPANVRSAARFLAARAANAPDALQTAMAQVYDFFSRCKIDPTTDFDAAA